MDKKNVNIEALVAKRDQISSQAVKNALAKLEAQKTEEQEERVIKHIASIQKNTEGAVKSLRDARAHEKRMRAYLQAVANAEAQFYKDADIDKYNVALNAAYALR